MPKLNSCLGALGVLAVKRNSGLAGFSVLDFPWRVGYDPRSLRPASPLPYSHVH